MPRPRAPKLAYLAVNAGDRATLHTDIACETLTKLVAARTGIDAPTRDEILLRFDEVAISSWEDYESLDRRVCRVCSLAKVTVGLLTPLARDRATTLVTVTGWPPVRELLPKKAGRRLRTDMSERAAERIGQVAALLGHRLVDSGTEAGLVMVGRVPARAVRFLNRNYWCSLPPDGVNLKDEVVAAAWSMFIRQPPERTAGQPDHVGYDQWWRLCEAAHL